MVTTTAVLITFLAAGTVGFVAGMRLTRAQAARELAREREAWERHLGQARADQEAMRSTMRDQFAALSADALRASQEQFLELADQRLRRSTQEGGADLQRREQAIRELVEPMARALDGMRHQTLEADRARAEGQAMLSAQIRQLLEASDRVGRKADDFINTLRRSDVRGNWGEVQLRRVVELAGMLPHVDFTEQDVVKDAEGRNLRPDMTVRLAGGRTVVVDSKVALVALLEAFETEDQAVRAERLQAHARHVRRHIEDLSSKRYWAQFDSAPEFVVMFVPSEAFYQAAVEQDSALQEYAYGRGVLIATPTTLVAMLRTVAHAWKEEALAREARQVLSLGRELHERLGTMAGHLSRMGRSLDSAGKAYNQAVASLESRVLVSARRFGEIQHLEDALPSPDRVETDIRPLAAPELTLEGAEQADASRKDA